MGRLDDQVAIVTGGAGGIGGAVARLLAAEGTHVAVADVRDTEAAQRMEEQTLASFRRVVDVNLQGPWPGMRAVAPSLPALERLVDTTTACAVHLVASSRARPSSRLSRAVVSALAGHCQWGALSMNRRHRE